MIARGIIIAGIITGFMDAGLFGAIHRAWYR